MPGASVAAVAQRHGVNANLLFKWLRAAGHGRGVPSALPATAEPSGFVPLGIVSDAAATGGALLELSSSTRLATAAGRDAGVIEIELAGARVRVDGSVETAALRRVLKVLKDLA